MGGPTHQTRAEPVTTLVDEAWQHAVRATSIIEEVAHRLAAAGAITELRQLEGMSASELDLLVYREIHRPCRETFVEHSWADLFPGHGDICGGYQVAPHIDGVVAA